MILHIHRYRFAVSAALIYVFQTTSLLSAIRINLDRILVKGGLGIPLLQRNFIPPSDLLVKSNDSVVVMIVIGTRPEAIKMAPIIAELNRRRNRFTCVLVITGQHRAMLHQTLDVFRGELSQLQPISLDIMEKNQSLTRLSVRVIESVTPILDVVRPDVVLVEGDTTTSYITALTAFYFKIPVGHVEAGLRTGDIYSPYPEELNRRAISNIAAFHFAPTRLNIENLRSEGVDDADIYLTGNPGIDALKRYASADQSQYVKCLLKTVYDVFQQANSSGPRVILLTAHRRENHGAPLERIMNAIKEILQLHNNVGIIYPVHANPNVRISIERTFPNKIFQRHRQTVNGPRRRQHQQLHLQLAINQPYLRRLFLIEPLSYPDIIKLIQVSYIVMTDSGGIQEEAAALGKPILILRESTERPEGVHAGVARLVGSSETSIVEAVNLIFKSRKTYLEMSRAGRNLYGDGTSAAKIVDALERDLARAKAKVHHSHEFRSSPASIKTKQIILSASASLPTRQLYEIQLVVVLTVWKRRTLETMLKMIREQTILQRIRRTVVIVFQNSNHIHVLDVIQRWQGCDMWHDVCDRVSLHFVKSEVATGYYGRFVVPLTLNDMADDGYFVICDDDVLWGSQYFENMLRVVDEGFLAVRNGRYLINSSSNLQELGGPSEGWHEGVQATFDEDLAYDFGGHVWAGRIRWLRDAWKHPPPSLATSEDFWLSAVLKVYYGIGTRRPRCPKPMSVGARPHLCACSSKEAFDHQPAELGDSRGVEHSRISVMRLILEETGFTPLAEQYPGVLEEESAKHQFYSNGNHVFGVDDTPLKNCLFWV